ncbi:MAG: outer membrane lipoprotein-sorting protein [Anaerolineaceae bacterium]
MNMIINDEQALDHILDSLIHDPNGAIPELENADPGTIPLLRSLVQAEQYQTLSAQEEVNLKLRGWQQVLERAHPERKSNTLPGAQKHFQFSRIFHAGWQRAALLAAVVLMAVGIGVIVSSRTSPVNAQQILEKTLAVTNLPSASGVQSLALIETGNAVPANTRLDALSNLNGDERIISETKWWYAAPKEWRVEYQQTILAADGSEISSDTSLAVSDGVDIWHYDPEQNTVIVNKYSENIGGKGAVALFGQNAQSLSDLLQQAATCYDPKISGRESVAGREAYVIDLGPSKCPSASSPEMNGRLVLWVDKETYFVLKQEQYNQEGSQVLLTSEVTQVQYNAPLDPGLFSFTPPAGAHLIDNRVQSTATATADSSESVEQTPSQNQSQATGANFEPLLPTWLPEELDHVVKTDGEFVTILFARLNDTPGGALMLREMPSALISPGGDADPQASVEHIGGVDVTVIRRGEACVTFEWDLGDLHLMLTNVYDPQGQLWYSCEQLTQVVESIRP